MGFYLNKASILKPLKLIKWDCECFTKYGERMNFFNRVVGRILDYYPIKSRSPYKYLPVFFVLGGSLEWFMINVPGAGAGETFYDVVRRNQSEKLYKEKLLEERREKLRQQILEAESKETD